MSKRPGRRAMLREKHPRGEFFMVTLGEPDEDCPVCRAVAAGERVARTARSAEDCTAPGSHLEGGAP